jgi:hypothetical protein
MSPYLEGGKFEKISGDTGEISPDWRGQGIKLQRITRTLDAFQHFVVAKSDENLLIPDLQSKTQAKFFITLCSSNCIGKAGEQYRGHVYASGPPATQVLSNQNLVYQIIDLISYSHNKSKGFGDGGIGFIRRFKSIHECNSIWCSRAMGPVVTHLHLMA